VAVDRPERYAKQLASHLGRRLGVREEGADIRLLFGEGDGDCLLRPLESTLELHATAPAPEQLDRVTEVVGRHLERFGQRDELSVTWQRG
jgi:hypothetical protein